MARNLPDISRPRSVPHRRFTPGLDLPSWFMDNIKSIDSNLHLVYHPHRTMWDSIINEYTGSLEDPRFNIHYEYGHEQWGFVLTDNNGSPVKENSWHLWRLHDPFGWAHVVKIEDHHGEYLHLLVNRLFLQANISDKYGAQAYTKQLMNDQAAERTHKQNIQQEEFGGIQEENEWLTRKAMENFEHGVTAPTNPTTSSIISYPGQVNRSRIERPLDDEEGGLILPDHLKN